jgi:hypothetical protein
MRFFACYEIEAIMEENGRKYLGTLSLFGGKSIKKLKKEICGLQKMKGNLQDIKEDKAERKNTNIEKNNNSLF